METDALWMRQAIIVSQRGFPAPNPHVGCVVVRDGEIVGRGHHENTGGPHAEVNALREAGVAARGATAYVTLEPCNHFGRTPPCSLALIEAGIARVVIACPDPNPKATGGAQALREAGIPVDEGVLAEEAAEHNSQFLFAIRNRRPRVTLKAAATLDGRIALPSGESKWITSEESRQEGHRLRAKCGAVLVGRRTVEADDPQLTARIEGVVNQPLRIVLDPRNRLTGKERVFDDAAPTRHVTGEIDLLLLVEELFEDGVNGILVEGGALTSASFVRAGLADRLEVFLAPKLFGAGANWLGDIGIDRLCDAPIGILRSTALRGPDIQLSVDLNR